MASSAQKCTTKSLLMFKSKEVRLNESSSSPSLQSSRRHVVYPTQFPGW